MALAVSAIPDQRLLAMIIGLLLGVLAHAEAQTVMPETSREKEALVVTGTVLDKQCYPSANLQAELKLRLQFTNSGTRPLILNRGAILKVGKKYFAFIDEEKVRIHAGETSSCILRGDDPSYDKELVSDYPNAHFIVLQPGQSHVVEENESVPLIGTADSLNRDDEKVDRYYLQIAFLTWDAMDPMLAGELQRKWEKIGMLWSESIWSEPIEFTFERKRTCRR